MYGVVSLFNTHVVCLFVIIHYCYLIQTLVYYTCFITIKHTYSTTCVCLILYYYFIYYSGIDIYTFFLSKMNI